MWNLYFLKVCCKVCNVRALGDTANVSISLDFLFQFNPNVFDKIMISNHPSYHKSSVTKQLALVQNRGLSHSIRRQAERSQLRVTFVSFVCLNIQDETLRLRVKLWGKSCIVIIYYRSISHVISHILSS